VLLLVDLRQFQYVRLNEADAFNAQLLSHLFDVTDVIGDQVHPGDPGTHLGKPDGIGARIALQVDELFAADVAKLPANVRVELMPPLPQRPAVMLVMLPGDQAPGLAVCVDLLHTLPSWFGYADICHC